MPDSQTAELSSIGSGTSVVPVIGAHLTKMSE
jgi:hypothetical protein